MKVTAATIRSLMLRVQALRRAVFKAKVYLPHGEAYDRLTRAGDSLAEADIRMEVTIQAMQEEDSRRSPAR